MTGHWQIRKGRLDDADHCRAFLPAGAAEPDWTETVVVVRDGVPVAFAGLRTVVQVEPLGAENPLAAILLSYWLDGRLASEPGFWMVVAKNNVTFNRFLAKTDAVLCDDVNLWVKRNG